MTWRNVQRGVMIGSGKGRALRHRWVSGAMVGFVVVLAALVGAPVAGATTDSYQGSLDASGTSWRAYPIDVASAGTISATLSWAPTSANLNLYLKNPSGTQVASATSTTANPETITYNATATGTYSMGVKAKSGAADYTLTVDYAGSALVRPTYVDSIGGGAAGHAEMYPSGLDLDGSGNVYIADTGDDQVERYAADGVIDWVVGTRGPKAPGRFSNPRDVAFQSGKVYVADTGYNRVQVLDAGTGAVDSVWSTRFGTIMGISAGVDGGGNPVILVTESSSNSVHVFSPAGTLLRTIKGTSGSAIGTLNGPRDAATDAGGDVFVADYANSRVVEFGPLGAALAAWGVNGTGPSQLKRPYGIEVGPSGDVYVADSNNYIHRYTSTGSFLQAYGVPGAGSGQFQMLRRVALGPGPTPDVYGADLWTYKIEAFSDAGAYLRTLGGVGPADGSFNEPYGVAVAGSDAFVMDMVNQRVQRFDSGTLAFTSAWGQRGWGEGNPGFNWARDVTIMPSAGGSTVWVADTKNNRITEFQPDGTPTGRKFGSPGSGIGQLNWPHAIDATSSAVFVADTLNNRIERWDPSGPSVVWDVGTAGGTSFSAPKDLTVTGANVYVADTLNRRIVVLDAATGAFVRSFGASVLHQLEGVAVDPSGNIWVADTNVNRLVEFAPDGTLLQTFGSGGSAAGKFNKPTHLEVFSTAGGNELFVVDSWNDRVQVFDIG